MYMMWHMYDSMSNGPVRDQSGIIYIGTGGCGKVGTAESEAHLSAWKARRVGCPKELASASRNVLVAYNED
jgi:hypothetical protein